MKKTLYILLFTATLCTSCEEVVGVDVGNSPPRLVVEASINWQKGSSGNYQAIRLSSSTGFYEGYIPTVSGATVFITNSSGLTFEFPESSSDSGLYVCGTFEPVIGETYILTIRHKEETYTAVETLLPVPDLLYSDQEEGSFINDFLTVKAYFNDPANEANFYMHRFIRNEKRAQSAVFDDVFVNGNLTFTVRLFDDLKTGDELQIELYGISERYYNYMNKIFATVSENNVGPFETPPAVIKGNLVNVSNPDNYAYGYFRLSEVSIIGHTVK